MPPKPKYTREEMIDEALKLINEDGADNLTARNLGKRLGISQTPIFVWFSSMEELRQEVEQKGLVLLKKYLKIGLNNEYPFRGVGRQYVRFAADNPNLYEFMFMMETSVLARSSPRYLFLDEEAFNDYLLKSLVETYQISGVAAEQITMHMLIYAHGIAALYAKKVCFFSQEEVNEMLKQMCLSLVVGYKTVDGIEDKNVDSGELLNQYRRNRKEKNYVKN